MHQAYQIENRKKVQHLNKQSGFSMIELLVVLVILGLLAGLVGQQFLGKVDTSKVRTAETQVKMLKMALQTYRLDNSRYPTDLKFLNVAPSENAQYWSGPYLSETLPLDPWGVDYVYQTDANAPQGFYLYSYGADNKAGGEGLNADVGYVPQS
ncbi:type II secretion system major pseudopilin GspG [Brumicola nitratireducens]|uniref:Type II secretion system core protein G n=1 Tax=Glaciecola nitratireducens (strain JCM 12485 / KCTC 12276 / FR1064) TaxID=1085623 RepID=G4QIP6_GLANF|nr:type II secretion system major pseudopilin GspG [Glaciecola nitratireducens]AEP31201.1 general secretion pathway protein G [Glaciecola nitratireducens FR1064]